MTRPSTTPPRDERLPGSELLFDLDAVRELLGAAPEARLRLRYVEHEPGVAMLVTVEVDGGLVAVSIGRTAPVSAGPQIARYPDDPGLPGLARGWDELLGALGVTAPGVEIARLAWVPHRRLAVAVGDVVVKLHATAGETLAAVELARLAGAAVPVPVVLAVDARRAAHAQQRVPGRALGRGDAVAFVPRACELLEDLYQLDARGLARHTPDELLAECGRVAALVGFLLPDRDDRVAALLERLRVARPEPASSVPSHGDFNVGQLLLDEDGTLVVVDVDTLCASSPAYDPASYAANLVAGRDGDLDDARAAADAFAGRLAGLERAELDWYVAAMVVRRLDRGMRRYKRDWPVRTERLLGIAEELAATL